ncbi:MAG: hypothetical protein IKO84_08070 [Butyrivibrio sp.]|nr:hypothetical protein [Butyrivibrio sp.]
MKKFIAIAISSVMVLSLMGCGVTALESGTTQNANITISDDQIAYNGNAISILDSTETSLSKLGKYDKNRSNLDKGGDYKRYDYGKKFGEVLYDTLTYEGKELPLSMIIISHKIKTSRNVGIGDTEEDIIAAYGEPTKITNENYRTLEYDMGDYTISFEINSTIQNEDRDKLESIVYKNDANYDILLSLPNL